MRLKRMSFEIHSCLRKIKRKWDIPPIHNIFLSSGLLEQSCALRSNTARYYYCEFYWPLTLYFSGSNHAKFMKRITFQLTRGLDLLPRNNLHDSHCSQWRREDVFSRRVWLGQETQAAWLKQGIEPSLSNVSIFPSALLSWEWILSALNFPHWR